MTSRPIRARTSAGRASTLCRAIGIRGAMCPPLIRGGRLVAAIAVAFRRRPVARTDEEAGLVQEVAERVWDALSAPAPRITSRGRRRGAPAPHAQSARGREVDRESNAERE